MIYLRKATINDRDLLYMWTNDPEVRRNSFNTTPVLYEDHKNWFEHMMMDDKVIQYILMEDDTPIGQIRLNVYGSEAEIGYSISKDQRGHGYGETILKLIMQEVKDLYPHIKRLVAKVKPDNTASRRLFEKEDYKLKYMCYTYDVR